MKTSTKKVISNSKAEIYMNRVPLEEANSFNHLSKDASSPTDLHFRTMTLTQLLSFRKENPGTQKQVPVEDALGT